MTLIIVESPTKAKTISRFLGKKYSVLSSYGHVRDLQKKALGIDIENNFEPQYIVPEKAQANINALQKKVKTNKEVILATDEDREGEAIAWHLDAVLNLHGKAKRIVFHEITETAIQEALKHPRTIDTNMVDAQQARRVLDRIVGFKLSPFLWSKVTMGLSAGRVQSVALRRIVEKEREIKAFQQKEYWSIIGQFKAKKSSPVFEASLESKNGKKVKQFDITTEKQATKVTEALQQSSFHITSVKQKEKKKSPNPPFITSTLQQTAGALLGYTPKRTMMLAQSLYEKGLITYHRTDSFNIAQSAIHDVRDYIEKEIGKEYVPETARFYKKKTKGAQEAHESIRPAFDVRHPFSKRHPDKIKIEAPQKRLYTLIWQRFVACQMKDAIQMATTVDIQASSGYVLRANGSVLQFDGFTKIYPTKLSENILPQLTQDEEVQQKEITPDQHFTQPPARYSEQSLVKDLEEHGIGRPSTYASIISTIQERNYAVRNEQKRLEPTEIGILVNDMMVEHFPKIVDIDFTSQMEEQLDGIAHGKEKWQKTIGEFYNPFMKNLEKKTQEVKKQTQKTDKTCTQCGEPMEKKMSKYGWFYACTAYPECKHTESTEEESGKELNITCNECGKAMTRKRGRYGVFLGCSGYPECKNIINLDQDENPIDQEPEQETKPCKKCGKPMVKKMGRFGAFLGCSGYPECKTIEPLLTEATKALAIPEVHCPKCIEGTVTLKFTKTRRSFYGCDKYPACDFALWDKPVIKKIPGTTQQKIVKCTACDTGVLVEHKSKEESCSNKECKKHAKAKSKTKKAKTTKKSS